MLGIHSCIAAAPSLAFPPAELRLAPESGILQLIRRDNSHLDEQDVRCLPMKLRSLLANEYDFYRGTADLFYEWCAAHCSDWIANEKGFIRLHGDVHLGNLGTHRVVTSDGVRLAFGLVDFDETVRGPFQLDLLRGAAALRMAVLAEAADLEPDVWRRTVQTLCQTYEAALRGNLSGEWIPESRAPVRKLIKQANEIDVEKHTRQYLADGFTDRFRRVRYRRKGSPSDLMEPVDEPLKARIVLAIGEARDAGVGGRFIDGIGLRDSGRLDSAVLDVVRWTRLGSAGSQGLKKYLVLLDANRVGPQGPFLIELKAEPSPAAARVGLLQAAPRGADRAREVAESHRRLWGQPPWLVGWTTIGTEGYLVRAKGPWSKELDDEDFNTPRKIEEASVIIGATLGRSHRLAIEFDAGAERLDRVVASIASRMTNLPVELLSRAESIEEHLRQAFEGLQADPHARRLAARAEAHIRAAARRH